MNHPKKLQQMPCAKNKTISKNLTVMSMKAFIEIKILWKTIKQIKKPLYLNDFCIQNSADNILQAHRGMLITALLLLSWPTSETVQKEGSTIK